MAQNKPDGMRPIQKRSHATWRVIRSKRRARSLGGVLIAILFGLGLVGQLSAEEEQWTSIGPPGVATVHSLAIQPNSAEIIYVGTEAGIFKSINRGETWTQTNSGLTSFFIFALAIDPGAPLTVYAGTQTGGVFRSSDGGASWTALSTGLPSGYARALAIDASSGTVYVGTNRGVFKTFRGGGSWIGANDGLTDLYIVSLALDPTSPLTVYAGTASGVFKSTNGGGAWVSAYGRAQQGIPALALAPYFPATMYAGTYYSGPSIGPPVGGDGVLRSTDSGATWSYIDNGLPSAVSVNALGVDPQASSTVYAGTNQSGVFKSTDRGANWTSVSRGLIDPNVFAFALDGSGTVYAGTGAGVFRLTKSTLCTADAGALCLNGGRFRVQVAWHALNIGASGTGQAVPLTTDTGYFWFFTNNNVELVIKVVDGREVNGHFWVFFGAMTDVEYTITVTDTQSGAVKTYQNSQGQLRSDADTSAF